MKLFKRCVTVLIILIIISCTISALLVYRKSDTAKITDNEKEKIFALLKEHDIKINKDCIPKEYPSLPCVYMINAIHERPAFGAKVLGENFAVFDFNTYTSENTTLTFEGNSFVLYFSTPDFNVTDEESAKKVINSLNLNADETFITINHSKNQAFAHKTLNGFCVFDYSIKMPLGKTDEIVGSWFEPTNNTFYQKQRPLISVFNEICENPELKGKTITAVTPGYKIGELSEYKKEVVAYPVWRITIDDTVNYDFTM